MHLSLLSFFFLFIAQLIIAYVAVVLLRCYFDVNKRFSTQIWLCQRGFNCSAFSLSFLCGKTHKQTSTVICQTFSFASPL